jgi:fatty acid desaturase
MFNPRTFPCPNCKEIINDTMRACPYCSAPVDPNAASAAAELQDKVNQACSDASYLRTAALVMFGFLGLSLIPFMPLVFWGFLFTFIAVIVLIVRWQSNFGKLQTADPDYAQAKRSRNVALVLWVLALPVGFIVRPLIGVIISGLFQ